MTRKSHNHRRKPNNRRFSAIVAQVLRKMCLKILASWFLMPYLLQTFESYQRIKIYTYSVNDLGLNFFTVI